MIIGEHVSFAGLDAGLDALDGRKRKGGILSKAKKVFKYATPPGLIISAFKLGKKKLIRKRKKKSDGTTVDEIVDAETGQTAAEVPEGAPVPGESSPPPPASRGGPSAPSAPAGGEEEAPPEEGAPEVAPTPTAGGKGAPLPAEAPESGEGEEGEEDEEEAKPAKPAARPPAAPTMPSAVVKAPEVPTTTAAEGPVRAAPAMGAAGFPWTLVLAGGAVAAGLAIFFYMRKKK